jgi:hypothetical protein
MDKNLGKTFARFVTFLAKRTEADICRIAECKSRNT